MGDNLQDSPNWNAILQWSLRQAADTPPADLTPLDEERKAFLSEALSNMANADPVKSMRGHVQALQSEVISEEDAKFSLEELAIHAEDLDEANDLYLIGGLGVVSAYLKHPLPSLKWRACEVIANTTQNNEKVMNFVIDNNDTLKVLLEMVDTNVDSTVRVKALYAVSCLIRGYADAQGKFSALEGYNVLIRALQSGIEKLQVKVLFLVRDICQTSPAQMENYINMGIVEELIGILSRPFTILHQQSILLLEQLESEIPCTKKTVLALKSVIPNLDPEMHREELAACTRLLMKLELGSQLDR